MKKIILFLSAILLTLTASGCSNVENLNSTESLSTQYNNESIINSTINEVGYKKLDVYYMNEIARKLPTTTADNGLSQYPAYNNTVTDLTLKTQILQENYDMYDFDEMDKDGYYYKSGVKTGQRLFKHTAADNIYPTSLSNSQTAVEKYMHVNNYAFNEGVAGGYGAITTGLYAPAGELITIEIPEDAVLENIEIYIGKMSSKGYTNDIGTNNNYSRMPVLTSNVTMKNTITYTGSPLGGLIYIYNGGARIDMDIKITGAVEATHYIVGSSTEEDLERTIASTAPLLEVDIPGQITATMGKSYCGELTVEKMLAGIDQWDKMTSVSLHVNPGKHDYMGYGVSALYDSHIPAGAATAIVGPAYSVNPNSWAANFFDVSISDWGSYHEYNHHYGTYDIIDNEVISEVSNNLLTVIGYVLYSDYSGYRTTLNAGGTGWLGQTRQSYAINSVNNDSFGYGYRLSQYVVLLHSFGVDKFIEFIQHTPINPIKDNSKADNMFVKAVEVFGYDMSYYFNEFPYGNSTENLWEVSDEAINWANSLGLEMFIPVGHEFQVGQVQTNYEEDYTFETILPFGYLEGQKLNLNNYVTVPHDMEFEILSVENPNVGNITKNKNTYFYSANFTPNTVDKFNVNIKVYNDKYSFIQTLTLGLCHQYSGGLINSVTTTIYDNVDGLSIDEIDLDNINLDVKQTFSTTKLDWAWTLNDTYNYGLFVNESALIFEETEEKTFYFKGKGDIKVYMGTNPNDMKLVCEFSDQASYDLNSRSYTMNVKKDQKIYTRVIGNTNVRSEFAVATHNGSSFVGLADNVYYGMYSSKEEVNTDYYKPLYDYNRFPQNLNGKEMTYTINPSDDAHIEYQTSSMADITFRGNSSSFSSAAAGSEVIYDFNEIVRADGISFNMAWSHGRTLKDFEVHLGNDPRNLTKVLDSTATDTYWYEELFDRGYQFRYAKVVFKSCHYNSNIAIYSINFRNKTTVNYLSGTNSELLYTGYAKEERLQGSFNGSIVEFNGEINFNFTGRFLNLYANTDSKYGYIEIKIDNGSWIKIDLNSDSLEKEVQLLRLRWLDNKEHKVTIRSNGLANIDYITYS